MTEENKYQHLSYGECPYAGLYPFRSITDDDGTPFFLSDDENFYLVVTGKRNTFPTPKSECWWREVKCGDTIIEYDEEGIPSSAYEVCEINHDHVLAFRKPLY